MNHWKYVLMYAVWARKQSTKDAIELKVKKQLYINLTSYIIYSLCVTSFQSLRYICHIPNLGNCFWNNTKKVIYCCTNDCFFVSVCFITVIIVIYIIILIWFKECKRSHNKASNWINNSKSIIFWITKTSWPLFVFQLF